MKVLRIDLADRSYDILIGQNLFKALADHVPALSGLRRAVLVTHPSLHHLYGGALEAGLRQAGMESRTVEIPEGEAHKTLASAGLVYDHLMQHAYDRNTLMVALGGGVIGDLTGFVAATYQRGVPFLQVPTTLLSQVDSSVGGKTAVNHPLGKNMIGAFYQPRAVIIDLDTLKSLPTDEFRAGMAEIIKYGVIEDPDLFAYLEDNVDAILAQDTDCLTHIIETSCAIKARVVERDERESNVRMILNYGHTVGHAIEALTEYIQFKHGEAVAIGMVIAARLSQQMRYCDAATVERITKLIHRYGLPTQLPDFPARDYIESMYRDKKAREKKIRFILVRALGQVEIVDAVPEAELEKVLLSQ
ncbi:3-dehydroquinate synthase [Nitrospina watsonii]|uniref:3-dehydroquinate synthase n=1 Tax=Nitrospina watsonii TaxID=1323948 RepID=A0ABM9HH45_9BACT|nr:3-dehydroquinate synthase [Nitrospina watsonii]CAI2719541.1 3-dehydroquinate synthase [Nitrospina watsonii]